MTDINHVTLIGRMTRDIGNNDFAYTPSGTARLNISIAVNESRKQNGQWQDIGNFFDITIWGKTAENLRQYLGKGKQLGIDGHLQQQRWQGQDGSNHSKVVVIAENVQLLGGKSDNANGGQQQGGGYQHQQQQPQNYGGGDYQDGEFPEDIPF